MPPVFGGCYVGWKGTDNEVGSCFKHLLMHVNINVVKLVIIIIAIVIIITTIGIQLYPSLHGN